MALNLIDLAPALRSGQVVEVPLPWLPVPVTLGTNVLPMSLSYSFCKAGPLGCTPQEAHMTQQHGTKNAGSQPKNAVVGDVFK